ncbi:DNA replication/repair protein RecF [Clostridium oryzae]|uniref:DNA replication and repair protein RecF n=1 Tax=Clostridium oryzae TaxID=1450648 RepID=A0A1V4I808_9CLOT|nr:DNA replication/repair protein RecF [Clostridium oryzae]OPJ56096.1 DNA replication and repair protein RecF [Clostridium oryzae]
MHVKSIQLAAFRNYDSLSIDLNSNINIFIGDNAQGKTNILESIYITAFGKSYRTSRDKELIQWNQDKAYINIDVGRERLDKKIEIKIFKDGKKAIRINSIKINKISELIGICNVVMFSPEDLKIVKESPSTRRRFLDMELCQIDKLYYHNLVSYNKALSQRNSILKEYKVDVSMLEVYDLQLAKYGEYIIKKRIEYIDKLNFYGKSIHQDITSEKETIHFKYLTQIKEFTKVRENLYNMLDNSKTRDMERHITSVGPHRDDFTISINGVDTKSFGSQGQQRTAVLTMKFSSLKIIKEVLGEYPILLLDDVLSELDFKRKKYILSSIKDVQTIITCTGIDDIKNYFSDAANVFYVNNGNVTLEKEE